jgi:hypothetical protein
MYSVQFSPIPPSSTSLSLADSPNSFGGDLEDGDIDFDNFDWSTGEEMTDQEAASEIDFFSSAFLPPTHSKLKGELPSPPSNKSLSTTKSFGLTMEDIISDTLLVEQALPYLPSLLSNRTLAPTSSAPTSRSNNPTWTIPSIDENKSFQPTSQRYVSSAIPNLPDQYILRAVPDENTRSQPIKRKRSHYCKSDESYPTDGKLLEIILNACENSYDIPNMNEGGKNVEKLLRARDARKLARVKLTEKQTKSKQRRFNGHYPDRKKVASTRKRVGGRFVKENKSVFRPVQSVM